MGLLGCPSSTIILERNALADATVDASSPPIDATTDALSGDVLILDSTLPDVPTLDTHAADSGVCTMVRARTNAIRVVVNPAFEPRRLELHANETLTTLLYVVPEFPDGLISPFVVTLDRNDRTDTLRRRLRAGVGYTDATISRIDPRTGEGTVAAWNRSSGNEISVGAYTPLPTWSPRVVSLAFPSSEVTGALSVLSSRGVAIPSIVALRQPPPGGEGPGAVPRALWWERREWGGALPPPTGVAQPGLPTRGRFLPNQDVGSEQLFWVGEVRDGNGTLSLHSFSDARPRMELEMLWCDHAVCLSDEYDAAYAWMPEIEVLGGSVIVNREGARVMLGNESGAHLIADDAVLGPRVAYYPRSTSVVAVAYVASRAARRVAVVNVYSSPRGSAPLEALAMNLEIPLEPGDGEILDLAIAGFNDATTAGGFDIALMVAREGPTAAIRFREVRFCPGTAPRI